MSAGTVFAAAFAIGLCTGLRTFTPITVLSLARVPATGLFASLLFWPAHVIVFPLAALGELILDKLPIPSRLAPPGLIARILFGALCAASLASAAIHPIGAATLTPAALLGSTGAVLGAFAGNRYRAAAGPRYAIPAALAEDALCIAASIALARLFL